MMKAPLVKVQCMRIRLLTWWCWPGLHPQMLTMSSLEVTMSTQTCNRHVCVDELVCARLVYLVDELVEWCRNCVDLTKITLPIFNVRFRLPSANAVCPSSSRTLVCGVLLAKKNCIMKCPSRSSQITLRTCYIGLHLFSQWYNNRMNTYKTIVTVINLLLETPRYQLMNEMWPLVRHLRCCRQLRLQTGGVSRVVLLLTFIVSSPRSCRISVLCDVGDGGCGCGMV